MFPFFFIWRGLFSSTITFFHNWSPSLLASLHWPELGCTTIICDVPQRWECDILLERSRNETSSKPLVHVCLRFTLWCICHFESIWFNLISVPGHPAILCAFSVTVAYGVRPTDSSANEGGLNSYFLDGFPNLATYLKRHISFRQFFPVLPSENLSFIITLV